jgi:hypothetical protein
MVASYAHPSSHPIYCILHQIYIREHTLQMDHANAVTYAAGQEHTSQNLNPQQYV